MEEREVGEEVGLAVDRPVDLLELGEVLLGEPLPLDELRAKRLGSAVAPKKSLSRRPSRKTPRTGSPESSHASSAACPSAVMR